MPWFSRQKSGKEKSEEGEKKVRTEGLWTKCDGCRQIIWKKTLESNLNVCPKCGYHFRIDAMSRLKMLFDESWETHDADLASSDPLGFVDSKPYRQRLAGMQKTLALKDAIISGSGKLAGRPVNICALELKFIGGSMGAVVGEVITRAIERSIANRMPLIIVSASGGARMQEGAISLMQLAKISAALMYLDESGIPFISVLTDPTTGGVTASFAMLGDLNIAEPGALIGFAGPRVIEQTIRQKLPEGFQRSEFLLKNGMLDAVVTRPEMKDYIAKALEFFCGPVEQPAAAASH
jgi:acetyl-CoA carboxylase carboxyl transferase subunit beta